MIACECETPHAQCTVGPECGRTSYKGESSSAHVVDQQDPLVGHTIIDAKEGSGHVVLALLRIQPNLWPSGSGATEAVLVHGDAAGFGQLPCQETRLVVSPAALTRRVEGNRDDYVCG